MEPLMWKKIDFDLIENPPARLHSTDQCYYAREYTSGKGFSHSDTNNLVSNFKMKVEHRGTPRWRHKERAIAQFAAETIPLLVHVGTRFVLAPVPCSKRLDHAEYDDRLVRVVRQIGSACTSAVIGAPVIRETTIRAAHESGSNRPSPAEVRASLAWDGLPCTTDLIILVDDVLTTGTTFRECQSLIQANAPNVGVIGLFWARTVWE
jgi:hypothetical protein